MENFEKKKETNNINDEDINEDVLKYESIKIDMVNEGKANVKLSNEDKSFSAFYNPAQEFNRDLSVISINTFFSFNKYRKAREIRALQNSKFSICECLSATGLRAIRYYLELDKTFIGEIVANDMDKKAVDCIYTNMEINNVDKNIFKAYQKEASELLYSHRKYFDVIDLDPYGSAIPMIDSALQSIKSGGLLCVTFTDMPVLCGNYPETTYYKYGSIPYKTSFCHEMAKRIALFAISSAASKYKKVIKPILSFNAEFYIRLFLIVKESPDDCKKNCLKYGYLYHCRNCQNRSITPLASLIEKKSNKKEANVTSFFRFNNLTGDTKCNICDSNMCMSGPYWIENLHDENFINDLLSLLDSDNFKYLKYNQRIKNFLNGVKEELPLENQVFNYDYSKFASDTTSSSPKLSLFKGALESLNFKMVQSYYDPNLFKTDAPTSVIYDIIKKYKKDNYENDYFKNVKEDSYKFNLLSKEIKINPIFDDSIAENNVKKSKYLPNPMPNWGPKAKAKEIKSVKESNKKDKNKTEDNNN